MEIFFYIRLLIQLYASFTMFLSNTDQSTVILKASSLT